MMERVQKWIEIARWAPSGGNAQPWHMTATSSPEKVELKLGISPEYRRAPSPMDVQGAAAVMALGSFVHNLRSICLQDGYHVSHVDFDYQESFWTSHLIIRIVPHTGQKTFLGRPYTAEEIQARRTDRGALKTTPLPQSFQDELRRILLKYNIYFHQFTSETTPAKDALISPFSKIEKVRLQNPILLQGLLKEIGFRKIQEEAKIPITQLGISKIDQFMLRFFRDYPWSQKILQTPFVNFPVYNIVHSFVDPCERICFLAINQKADSKTASEPSATEYKQAFELGECFQNIWLEAHRHGISFQPLGLPLIVLGYRRNPDLFHFKKSSCLALEQADQEMKGLGVDFSNLAIGFRLGETLRLAPKAQRRNIWVEGFAGASAQAKSPAVEKAGYSQKFPKNPA